MSKEAMKLALEAAYLAGFNASGQGWNAEHPFQDYNEHPEKDEGWVQKRDAYIREALAEKPAQQEPVSDRENAIIRFALHQFMSNAYSNMNAAAQDKDSRHYTVGAVEKFAKDAKEAEALLSRLQFKAPQPAQRKPWVGLTEQEAAECWSTSTVRTWQAIEAKLREKNA